MNRKIKSIKVKIILFLIPMLLVAFTVLSGLGYKFASDSLRKSNLNVMAEMTKTAAGRADDQIKNEIRNLEVIASNPTISDENILLKDKVDILKPALNTIGQVGLSISDKEGNSIDTAGNTKKIKTTQSFMKSIKGENSISNPYVDPVTNAKVIAYSVPIKDSKGNIIGTITSVKDCKDFAFLNKEIRFLQTGSALIVDSNGNFIVAEDETLVSDNKNITNMTSDKGSLEDLNNIGKSMIIGNQSGIGKYIYEGKTKYISYSPIGKTGLSIGITVEEKDLLSALSSLAVVDSVVTIIMIILISAMIIGFAIKVISRLLGAKTYVDSIAKGDFYTQISDKYIRGNDEISEICLSVGQAKNSVGGMIRSVRDNANIVREGSVSLTKVAENLSVLAEEISASISEVSVNTSNQSSDFEVITNKLTDFGDKVNDVKEELHLISEDVSVINEKSSTGAKNIEELNEGIISVNDSFERFSMSIEYMQGDMKNVNQITNIINGISEQINILAFNAAIEAASAGEAGKGFNVIASEVKKLSDKSKESSQNISKIINRLMKIINKLVEESSNMDSELERQKHIIYDASSSFSEIAVLVNEITPRVSNINDAFKDIGHNKDLIVDTVFELSEEVKNTSNSLEMVTDSSIELAKFAETVNGSADVLLYKADELIEKVGQFRIDKEEFFSEEILKVDEMNLINVEREDRVEKKVSLKNLKSEEIVSVKDESNIVHEEKDFSELNYVRELDLALVEELKDLAKPSEEELNLQYETSETINIDLSLAEKVLELSVSPLERLEDMPTQDFGWGCSKVTELKNYIKDKEIKEHIEWELEYKELI
ncbi:methyl-accepting chemotaxis protein [Clostridium sp. C2-6-12]|uniref:methyl-accepting chemotaxis protein n=1 Tax=Clostridium sp. C2-6-12 TaxID=2698832 RepID=UPI00136E9702|nr:methyl-accepting chemotaxis protein [Clostridium sp. C2-6-12]